LTHECFCWYSECGQPLVLQVVERRETPRGRSRHRRAVKEPTMKIATLIPRSLACRVHPLVPRLILAGASLASLVLAAGAGFKWL